MSDLSACDFCMDCCECFDRATAAQQWGGYTMDDYLQSKRWDASDENAGFPTLQPGTVVIDMRTDKSKPGQKNIFKRDSSGGIRHIDVQQKLDDPTETDSVWESLAAYDRHAKLARNVVLAVLFLALLACLCLFWKLWMWLCPLAVHAYAVLKRCWQWSSERCLRAYAATKSALCILRTKNHEITGLDAKLTLAQETINEQRTAMQRTKEESLERDAKHETEKADLRKDISSLEFKIQRLERPPNTADAGAQTEMPENWQPFETLRPELDRAYAELREQTEEIKSLKHNNASLAAANSKLRAKKRSYKKRLKEIPESPPRLVRSLSESDLHQGPGFSRYSQMEAAFNLKQNRKIGEPSLATMSVAPDPDLGEFGEC